jgi:hypothetical protein
MQVEETYLHVSSDYRFPNREKWLPSPKEEGVQVGSLPIMVRSKRCNLHPGHIAGDRQLYPTTSTEDSEMWNDLLRTERRRPSRPWRLLHHQRYRKSPNFYRGPCT